MDTMSPTERLAAQQRPLTPDEEADLRRSWGVVRHGGAGLIPGHWMTKALAALDAERAGVRLTPAPSPDALRRALETETARVHNDAYRDGTTDAEGHNEFYWQDCSTEPCRTVRAALATHSELPPECTGNGASWCPVHGNCSCERGGEGDISDEDPNCQLHGLDSEHGSQPAEPPAASPLVDVELLARWLDDHGEYHEPDCRGNWHTTAPTAEELANFLATHAGQPA